MTAAIVAGIPVPAGGTPPIAPEDRAIAYLVREVPRWSTENGCFSCHNNGDGARALYDFKRRSGAVPAGALADTTRWLEHPERWEHNKGDPRFSDMGLARIQFTAALAAATDAGLVRDTRAVNRAAHRLADDQREDGTRLATLIARRTLHRADPERFGPAVAKADRWLRSRPIHTLVDAAVALLETGRREDTDARRRQATALALIRRGQSRDGGWGPFVTAPPETFDTALVVLALSEIADSSEVHTMRRRGRSFLIRRQLPDGGWPETTRPTGADSYAQRMSTTAWAARALLATQGDSSHSTSPRGTGKDKRMGTQPNRTSTERRVDSETGMGRHCAAPRHKRLCACSAGRPRRWIGDRLGDVCRRPRTLTREIAGATPSLDIYPATV
jgi:hypothetical protein